MAMIAGLTGFKRWIALGVAAFLVLVATAAFVYRDDILRTALDPKVPFQTYDPPPAPDYLRRDAWALMPADPQPGSGDLAADVFFVHPTTYDGGRHWNAPLDEKGADRNLRRVMLPNYAGPFVRVGRIFAPRYRQASLYTRLTLRDDARDARRFAYGDVRAAFRTYVERYNQGRPFVLAGVEQGGEMAERLLREEIAANPELLSKMAGAYLIGVAVPAQMYGPGAQVPACTARRQARCLVAYAGVLQGDLDGEQALLGRSLVWDGQGQLTTLGGREPLCVNPLLGAAGETEAPPRANLGATNATGLEWGARPAFLKRQVGAQCDDGVLRITRPKSDAFKPAGSWTDRRKAPGYNLFYADIEADAQARVATLLGRRDFPTPAPPIRNTIEVDEAPVRRIN